MLKAKSKSPNNNRKKLIFLRKKQIFVFLSVSVFVGKIEILHCYRNKCMRIESNSKYVFSVKKKYERRDRKKNCAKTKEIPLDLYSIHRSDQKRWEKLNFCSQFCIRYLKLISFSVQLLVFCFTLIWIFVFVVTIRFCIEWMDSVIMCATLNCPSAGK